MEKITCFKAYDVRGRIPDQLNEDIARRIGRAYAEVIKPSRVVVGHDIRLTSEAIKAALTEGLLEQGVDVYDIGLCGTEEIYFATSHAEMDGGVAVTASHNPKDYNGMKFVREQSMPISGDTGLFDIQALAEANEFTPAAQRGQLHPLDTSDAYIKHLLGYVDIDSLTPLKIVVNAGNGGAGRVIDLLEPHLPFEFIKVHHQPDGNFPNGVPNPLLEENRAPTIAAVREHDADLGIAWDGDFDRCFFFDAAGEFIEGYYLVGLLAEAFLKQVPGAAIVHDPRLTWNTVAMTEALGGRAVQSKTGHAFIKERMRLEDAVYGGEMSASRDLSLTEMVSERMAAFPCSGEINRTIEDPASVLAAAEAAYSDSALAIGHVDGLSMEFEEWRFNLRMSNTEPVVRLNVESRADVPLMQQRRDELLALIAAG